MSLAVVVSTGGFLFGIWIIVNNAVAGLIAIGSLVYLIQTLSRVNNQTSRFLNQIARLLERNLYVTDIFAVLDTEPRLIKAKNPKALNLKDGEVPRIEFKNVSFKYDGNDRYAIKDISFVLEPGMKLGLVGNNGSGKSTIVRILLRIYDPTSGEVLINGINIKNLNQEEWWSCLGVLLQDYTTYNFTVREAIAVGKVDKEIDQDRVIKSAEQSTVSSFVEVLEKKYDNPIGVEFGGIEPSKGQRQKLAIARALYRDPKILVLDEPTASIDSESAMKIFTEIENLPPTTSAILISHNFATIKRANNIIVLENGEIIEQGSHEDLVSRGGMYSKAFLEQKKEFE